MSTTKTTEESAPGWERALDAFLRSWKVRRDVVGALVTGSYAMGTQTDLSDIDVHIVLSPNVAWRERGNQRVDGFLIEYFANPPQQIERYMELDHATGRLADAHMFTVGRILFDKTGDVRRLKRVAARWMKRPLSRARSTGPRRTSIAPATRAWQEQYKYAIWDHLDGLQDLAMRDEPSFLYVYAITLELVVSTYARFLRAPLPPYSKLHRFLSDPAFTAAYRLPPFPDRRFVELVLPCFAGCSLPKLEAAARYVQDAMGGFEIDGWKHRTKVELT